MVLETIEDPQSLLLLHAHSGKVFDLVNFGCGVTARML